MTTEMRCLIYRVRRDADGTITLVPLTTTRYLTVAQIARELDVSRQTVYSAIEAGKLKALRIESAVRVTMEDYLQYLADCRLAEYERPLKRKDLEAAG